MARHQFDKSSKWLIQKHGDSILRLGGILDVRSWRALQAELVQPRRLPDGLLEVFFHGRAIADYFLVEVATYPEQRLMDQVLNDLTLAYHQLQVLPEMLTVILHPKGRVRVRGHHEVASRLQWSRLGCRWKLVELWELSAEQLLTAGDVGLVPWVPLTQFTGPPEPIFKKCKQQIDEQALPGERENLLAVSQVLAQLRYNDPKLLSLLGGKRVMIESPLIKEIVAESKQEAILDVLQARFGPVPEALAERLRGVRGEKALKSLIKHAARCPDLEAFQARLP